DSRFDESLHFIGPFFDLLVSGYNPGHRKTEKFVGPRQHNKAHLLTKKIRWRTTQSGSDQPLLHRRKTGFQWACGKKLYLLVRVQARMLEYVPCYDAKIAAEDIDPDRLTSKLLDRLKLGPGNERGGGAGHVTSGDFHRSPPRSLRRPRRRAAYNNRFLR